MLHPSTKRLIDKLSDMTRKQRVIWTEGENGSVVHDTEGYRVVLTPEPHAVLLTDALGREIESCLPEEFGDETDAQGRPYSKFVADLYREANRHARGTEQAIRALLAGLDAVETQPLPVANPPAPPPAPVAALVEAPDATTDETAPIESETEITAALATLADQINGQEPVQAPAPLANPPEAVAEPAPSVAQPVEPAPVTTLPEPEPVATAEPVSNPEPEPIAFAQPVPEEPAPSVEVLPLAEEPGSFGTFAAFERSDAPPEPVSELYRETSPPEEIVAATDMTEAAPEPGAPTEPEPATFVPTLSKPISLSSIPFGFGLGAAQRAGAPSHPSISAPEAEREVVAEPARRIVIDGTLDLPDGEFDSFEDEVVAAPYPPPAPEAEPLDLPGEPLPPAPEPGQPRRFNPWN